MPLTAFARPGPTVVTRMPGAPLERLAPGSHRGCGRLVARELKANAGSFQRVDKRHHLRRPACRKHAGAMRVQGCGNGVGYSRNWSFAAFTHGVEYLSRRRERT